MDVNLSRTYLESLRRRTGGFSWEDDGPIMKPFPAPCLAGVIVFAPFACNPTTGSNVTLGLFGAWSYLEGTFLLEDRPVGFVPLGIWPPASFFLAAWALIMALLLASFIFAKVDGWT